MTENAPDEVLEGEVVAESTEIEAAPSTEVVNPVTGEVLDLSSATDELLGRILEQARDVEGGLKGFKKAIQIEVHRRLDGEGRWTREAGPIRLVGQGPLTPDYDPGRAREALEVLRDEGKISEATLERCCPLEDPKPKPKKGEIAKLRRSNPDADALLEEAEKPVDQTSRSVKVEEVPERFRELPDGGDGARP